MRSCGAILGEYGAPPPRLVNWLQDQSRLYFEETKAKRFRLHNLRGTAVRRARMAGVAESDAAVAFGCNPSTMPELQAQKRRMEAIKPVRGESLLLIVASCCWFHAGQGLASTSCCYAVG